MWNPLPVRNIGSTRVLVPGHQNSGAPTFFFGVFLMVFSHLCWQCSDKTRKCQEHKNTLRKKEKLIFLMPILEITIKTSCQLERAPEFWCPYNFFGVFLIVYSHLCWQCSDKTRKCQDHISILEKKINWHFLRPFLRSKHKNCCSTWKGTRVLVPGHQNSGAPKYC